MASRRVVRLTPSSLASSTSPGSFSPGARRRSTAIMVYSRSAVCWDRLFFSIQTSFFSERGRFPLDRAASILYYKVRQCKSCMTT